MLRGGLVARRRRAQVPQTQTRGAISSMDCQKADNELGCKKRNYTGKSNCSLYSWDKLLHQKGRESPATWNKTIESLKYDEVKWTSWSMWLTKWQASESTRDGMNIDSCRQCVVNGPRSGNPSGTLETPPWENTGQNPHSGTHTPHCVVSSIKHL